MCWSFEQPTKGRFLSALAFWSIGLSPCSSRESLASAQAAIDAANAGGIVGTWLASVASAQEFEIVSIADSLDHSLVRTNLLNEFPLKVQILGLSNRSLGKWKNLNKLQLLHDHVAKLPPGKIVFVFDLFDVVWLHCWRDLVEEFRRFKKPIVFSADFEPYPMENETIHNLDPGYPSLHGAGSGPSDILWVRRRAGGRQRLQGLRSYRFVNSGCFVGYATALKKALGRMLANNFDNQYVLQTPLAKTATQRTDYQVGSDDQIAWHSYAWFHPDEIAVDYRAAIFISVFGFTYQDFELRDGFVWVRPFNHEVCFAHGNGASNLAMNLREVQRYNAQPYLCRDAVDYSVDGESHYYLQC